jgi:hypothetical protein
LAIHDPNIATANKKKGAVSREEKSVKENWFYNSRATCTKAMLAAAQ